MQILGHETIVDQYLLDMKREINPSEEYVKLNRQVLKKLVGSDFKTISKYDILAILDKLRKPEESDPLHKWIGSYNLYIIILKRFFKWLGNPECMEGIKELKRKEKSIYKPSDMWTVEDDLLFLKYCNNKRDKCYHAISRDSSCRPSELLKLKVKDVLFKHANGKQYAEILVNGKTGTRHIPLINSIPYTKDWLDEYPFSNNPNASLISGLRQSLGKHINRKSLHETYDKYKKEYFPKLLDNPAIAPEEKKKIEILPNKPWNPYIRRHSALTEKSKILKEHILRQHAGWTGNSQMHLKYLHYYGNESNEAILEAYGLKPKAEEINKMQPVTCPNCLYNLNKIGSKFCAKCRMILSYDAYTETVEGKESEIKGLQNKYDRMESKFDQILSMIQQNPKLAGVKKEVLSNF